MSSVLALFFFASPLRAQPVDEVSTELRTLVDQADEILGGTRADDLRSVSTLRLSGHEIIQQNEKPESQFRIRVTYKLGILERWQREVQEDVKFEEKKLRHFAKDELYKARPSNLSPPPVYEKVNAQARSNLDRDPWRFSLEKHFHAGHDSDIALTARLRKDREFAKVFNSFAGDLGWTWKGGVWRTSVSDAMHFKIARRWTANLTNELSWLLSSDDAYSVHSVNLVWVKSQGEAFVASAGMTRIIEPKAWQAEAYSVGLTYRRQTLKDNFFVSIAPALSFPRATNCRSHSLVILSAEVVF